RDFTNPVTRTSVGLIVISNSAADRHQTTIALSPRYQFSRCQAKDLADGRAGCGGGTCLPHLGPHDRCDLVIGAKPDVDEQDWIARSAQPFAVWQNGFSADELDAIAALGETQ